MNTTILNTTKIKRLLILIYLALITAMPLPTYGRGSNFSVPLTISQEQAMQIQEYINDFRSKEQFCSSNKISQLPIGSVNLDLSTTGVAQQQAVNLASGQNVNINPLDSQKNSQFFGTWQASMVSGIDKPLLTIVIQLLKDPDHCESVMSIGPRFANFGIAKAIGYDISSRVPGIRFVWVIIINGDGPS